MKREMSKARQALVDSYIESLEKEIIPWKQGWSTVKNYNPVTKTQYRGINRLILYNAVAKNNYNDPRWMVFFDISTKLRFLFDCTSNSYNIISYTHYGLSSH